MYENNQIKPKLKRKPSKWQLFLKDCIPSQPKDAGIGEKITLCSTQYKHLKEKEPKKLDEIINRVQIQYNLVTEKEKKEKEKENNF